jgi:hypothetical protein
MGCLATFPVHATFHLVEIQEVMAGANDDPAIQFIELTMLGPTKNARQSGDIDPEGSRRPLTGLPRITAEIGGAYSEEDRSPTRPMPLACRDSSKAKRGLALVRERRTELEPAAHLCPASRGSHPSARVREGDRRGPRSASFRLVTVPTVSPDRCDLTNLSM